MPAEESNAFFVGKTTGVAMLALPTQIVFPLTENFVFLRAYTFAVTVVIILFGDDSSPSSEEAMLPSLLIHPYGTTATILCLTTDSLYI